MREQGILGECHRGFGLGFIMKRVYNENDVS
jgi:hypothetical protein